MEALAAAGDRAGALRHARIHAQLVEQEFGTKPDPAVVALAERLRGEPAAAAMTPGSEKPPGAEPSAVRAPGDVASNLPGASSTPAASATHATSAPGDVTPNPPAKPSPPPVAPAPARPPCHPAPGRAAPWPAPWRSWSCSSPRGWRGPRGKPRRRRPPKGYASRCSP